MAPQSNKCGYQDCKRGCTQATDQKGAEASELERSFMAPPSNECGYQETIHPVRAPFILLNFSYVDVWGFFLYKFDGSRATRLSGACPRIPERHSTILDGAPSNNKWDGDSSRVTRLSGTGRLGQYIHRTKSGTCPLGQCIFLNCGFTGWETLGMGPGTAEARGYPFFNGCLPSSSPPNHWHHLKVFLSNSKRTKPAVRGVRKIFWDGQEFVKEYPREASGAFFKANLAGRDFEPRRLL
ncbi:hypothetical protein K440DRAFT_643925 [Wilcoxina mikolae CBS 423.85]|nr:hypothetical protein K440DRAFT_643925 [Wilcoxina mikolae CBS 423.85]